MATENMKRGRINNCFSSNIAKTTMSAQSSSPADKVLSIDDLLTGILLRLPVRSLLRLKSVSKHWYFLITSPSFKLLRSSRNPDPPSGLFVPIRDNKSYLEYEFLSFDNENPVKAPFRTPNFDPNATRIDIEHSANGLMLCASYGLNRAGRYMNPNKYYVYSPTINQFITLSGFEDYDHSFLSGMTIAFDPSKSSDYRIIYVHVLGNAYLADEINYQIEIFSSTTSTWKPSCQLKFDTRVHLYFKNGVYWNNAIHWIQEGYILYFNLDEESIHEKPTPLGLVGLDAYSNEIFESRDQLLIVELERLTPDSKIKIHELKRDYSEWTVKYHVDLEEIGGLFTKIMHPRLLVKFKFNVLSLVLGVYEDDSFLVLEIIGKALRFNLVTKTVHKLYDFPASRYGGYGLVFTELQNSFRFRESLYSF